jgi:hypothetical protein
VIHINYVEQNEKKQENITKQTCNTVVTESGIFKLLVLTSLMQNLYYIHYQKVQPLVLLLVIYLYKFSLPYSYFQKSASCLPLRDLVHIIHLSINWIQVVKVPLGSCEERKHSISSTLFSKRARCLSLHRLSAYPTSVHELGYKL